MESIDAHATAEQASERQEPRKKTYDLVLDAHSRGVPGGDIADMLRISRQACQQHMQKGIRNGDPRALVVHPTKQASAKQSAYRLMRAGQAAELHEKIVGVFAETKSVRLTAKQLDLSESTVWLHVDTARKKSDERAQKPGTKAAEILALWNSGMPGPEIRERMGVTANYIASTLGRSRKMGLDVQRRRQRNGSE